MRSSFAVFALAALAAAEPVPQGVTSAITPQSSPPSGCSGDYRGSFQIAPVNVTSSSSKRSLIERQDHNVLTISLAGGILTDSQGRTGYIASNGQFQFDNPPQAGAIYTAGFSVCANGHLALGGKDEWEKCLSGPGSTNGDFFYNLYYENGGGQCIDSYILAQPYGSGSGPIPVGGAATTTGATTSAGSSTTADSGSVIASSSAALTTPVAGNSTLTRPTGPTTGKNGTAIASSTSGSGGATTTSGHTGAGATTHQTTLTSKPTGTVVTTPGQVTETTTGGTAAGGAAPSTTSGGAAPTFGLTGEAFGLAAGVLAYAIL